MDQAASLKRGIQVEDIMIAYQELKDIVAHTPLQKNQRLSDKYECNVYLKEKIYSMYALLNYVVLTIK